MSDQIEVKEEQDRYDLKTEHGFYLKSHDFVGSSTWKMGIEVIVLTEYLLCTATHTPWKFYCRFQKKEVWIQRGEICKSISKMLLEIEHLSRKQIRTALEKLKSSNFLEDITPNCVNGARSYKHFRITKYDEYQDISNYLNRDHRPVRGQLAANYGPVRGHDLKNEKNVKKEKNKYSCPKFAQFWGVYPKPFEKPNAYKEWKQLNEEVKDQILKVLNNGYQFNKEKRYIPYPAKWLKQEGWNDVQYPERRYKDSTYDPNSPDYLTAYERLALSGEKHDN